MSLSNYAKLIVHKLLPGLDGDTNKLFYTVSVQDNRSSAVPDNISSLSIKFNKPVDSKPIEDKSSDIFKILEENLRTESLGAIDYILAKSRIKIPTTPKTKAQGTVSFGRASLGGSDPGMSKGLSIRTKAGTFMSISNFKVVLAMLVKKYMMEEMTSGRGSLVNRTGRFIVSTEIEEITVSPNSTKGLPVLNIRYSYMEDPYRVFDPQASQSTLASFNRNPRKIIGDALHLALGDLVSPTGYLLNITKRT